MRVLLVEDDAEFAQHLGLCLTAGGFHVQRASAGKEALLLGEGNAFDVVLLDVTLPDMDGFSVVEEFRRRKNRTPVIFLTGKNDVEDRVRGLEAGGDDYLPKPFSLAELKARLRALNRRAEAHSDNVLRFADLELDPVSHSVTRGGERRALTMREFAVLALLMESAPRPVSVKTIVEHVWRQPLDSRSKIVNVYVKHLRKKLERPGLTPLLQTIRGTGFALRQLAE
jgi:DNA-binding response OmpR family regulator